MDPQPFLCQRNLVKSRRGLNKMDVNVDWKIKEIDEFKDELGEFKAMYILILRITRRVKDELGESRAKGPDSI